MHACTYVGYRTNFELKLIHSSLHVHKYIPYVECTLMYRYIHRYIHTYIATHMHKEIIVMLYLSGTYIVVTDMHMYTRTYIHICVRQELQTCIVF